MNTLAAEVGARHGIPAALVVALIDVESGGNAWAWNPEPHYRYLWDVAGNRPFRKLTPAERLSETPPADFRALAGDPDQEFWGQQASWGLMQVMGAVARERGFRGPYLPELCVPELNLDLGCRQLAHMHSRYWRVHGWDGVIAAYNAGSPRYIGTRFENQGYVDKVRRALKGAVL